MYRQRPQYLFADRELREVLEEARSRAIARAEVLSEGRIVSELLDELAEEIAAQFRLEVPRLNEEGKHTLGAKAVKVDVSGNFLYGLGDGRSVLADGTEIVVVVPFSGDSSLFKYRASTYSSVVPQGRIEGSNVILRYVLAPHEASALRERVNRDIEDLRKHLAWVDNDVQGFLASLPASVRGALERRRERLIKSKALLEELGLPVRREEDNAWSFAPPDIRKRSSPAAAQATAYPSALPPNEPVLPLDIFDHILEIIERFAMAIERSPGPFQRAGEEELRDMLLVQLNGHYEGRATGETFNARGKTDIYVPVKEKHVFIAECKFWKGAKAYLATIDQLLGYTTWRESKAAIVIFNRNRDHSAVLAEIEGTTRNHASFKRFFGRKTETQLRFALTHPEDDKRELLLAIVALNLPPK